MTKLTLIHDHTTSSSTSGTAAPSLWRSVHSYQGESVDPWAEREFAEGPAPESLAESADAAASGLQRREMLKLMGASAALATGAGCVRRPEEEILPYVKQPEDVIPGVANFYATALPSAEGSLGVLVESHEGRPTKVEGNPDHPSSLGKTGGEHQLAALQMYDPDRSRQPLKGGNPSDWKSVDAELAGLLKQHADGKGLAVVDTGDGGPATQALRTAFLAARPNAKVFDIDPLTPDNHILGAESVFGAGARQHYNLQNARVIFACDSNFLAEGPEYVKNAGGFGAGRRFEKVDSVQKTVQMNRLYSAEGIFSPTGSTADHRIRVSSAEIPSLLQAVAAGVLKSAQLPTELGGAAATQKVLGTLKADFKAKNTKFVPTLVKDLLSHKGKAAIVVGERQPAGVHALAALVNAALGAFNGADSVCFLSKADGAKPHQSTGDQVNALTAGITSGSIKGLVVLGSNLAYTSPGALNISAALQKANTVHFGQYADETAQAAKAHGPLAHPFEAWGDTQSFDGAGAVIQPLILPLFDGRSKLDVWAQLAGRKERGLQLVRALYTELGVADDKQWRTILQQGTTPVRTRKASPLGAPAPAASAAAGDTADGEGADDSQQAAPAADLAKALTLIGAATGRAASANALDVVFTLSNSIKDGRFANLAWAQELPDAMTKLVWDNALMISPALAKSLGLANAVKKNRYVADMVSLSIEGQSVSVPTFVVPGMAEHTVAIAIGYGRSQGGYVANGVGFNVNPARPKSGAWLAKGTVSKSGGTRELCSTQDHFSLDTTPLLETPVLNKDFETKRPIALSGTVAEYKKNPEFAQAGQIRNLPGSLVQKGYHEKNPAHPDRPIQPTDEVFDYSKGMQWGMVIDLTACTACSACTVACQAENNIPVVGRDQVFMGREMHWIRLDRYFSGDLDEPESITQPVACTHCENAPCEPVCPVAATVHGEEGINAMVYNRCIGTRYCANNCPLKVRRFNYFDFTKTAHLYVEKTEKERHRIIKMQRNPDVSVRFRGVIEKCSYCTQRIQEAKYAAKRAGRDSKNLPDGAITVACEQACPTGAITFGNINDEKSRVARRKKSDRNYEVLSELNIRPRTTYLAKLKNQNPELG